MGTQSRWYTIIVCVGMAASSSLADGNYTWLPSTGDWNTGTNWSPTRYNGPNDLLHIDNGGTANYSPTSNKSVGALYLDYGQVNHTLCGLSIGNLMIVGSGGHLGTYNLTKLNGNTAPQLSIVSNLILGQVNR
jgi:hypothetical protein